MKGRSHTVEKRKAIGQSVQCTPSPGRSARSLCSSHNTRRRHYFASSTHRHRSQCSTTRPLVTTLVPTSALVTLARREMQVYHCVLRSSGKYVVAYNRAGSLNQGEDRRRGRSRVQPQEFHASKILIALPCAAACARNRAGSTGSGTTTLLHGKHTGSAACVV